MTNSYFRQGCENRFWYFLKRIVPFPLLFSVVYLWYLIFWIGPGHYSFKHTDTHARCTIPHVDPFNKDIMAYYWKPEPIVCTHDTDLVYIDFDEIMHINYSRTSSKSLNCSFQSIVRKPLTDDEVTFGKLEWFTDQIKVTSDFVHVQCYDQDNLIYENQHSHIFKSRKPFVSDSDRYSILIVGVDSVSRLAAIRELPKTLHYLQNTLKGIVMNGYTKYGESTIPNFVALLSGKIVYSKEFPVDNKIFFDKHSFLWNNFTKEGGVTMFSEDWPRLSTFNYAAKGFNQTPTNHYFRPFYLGIEHTRKYQSSIHEALMFFENKNIKLGKTSTFCHGDYPRHVIQLDYYKRFLIAYRNKLKFGLSWFNEISHDYVNFVKLLDEDFLHFLKFLKEDGHLQRSFVILMSDHGSRVDKIRNTPIGRLEERLPFFSIVMPESIRKKHPHLERNLYTNTERLTSHFDAHETLNDILNNNFNSVEVKKPYPRGISLFSPIPKDRSCADAAIDEQSCACDKLEDADFNSTVIKQISTYLVIKLNADLSIFDGKCAKLILDKILDAKKIKTPLQHNEQGDSKTLQHYFRKPAETTGQRYLVLVSVIPSSAMFEATIEQRSVNKFSVLGHVSRTNRYGNQSACINNKEMKPYCYCKTMG